MVPLRISEQTLVIEENWDRCEREIERLWNEGFMITDFDYGDGVYHVIMSAGTGWREQYIESGREFPERHIEDGWSEGYLVTNIAIDDEEWILVFTSGSNLRAQSWQSTHNFHDFEDMFHELTYNGQTVTKMAYDDEDELYIAMVAEGLNWEQKMSNWEDMPEDVYVGGQRHRPYNRNYRTARNSSYQRSGGRFDSYSQGGFNSNHDQPMVTDIIDHDGDYFFIESFGTPYREQRMHLRHHWDDIDAIVQECWDEGFFITTAAHINDEWVLVFSK